MQNSTTKKILIMTNVPHNRKSIRRNEVKKKYEHQIEFDIEKVANAAHKP